MKQAEYASTTKTALLLAVLLVCPVLVFAVDSAAPSSVDVYWKSTRTIVAPGVSSVIVLDEDIANAHLGNDTIEFAGLTRGDTVALAYVNGAPVSIVVHVIEHPTKMIPPSLLQREAEMAHGTVGSDLQTSNAGGANSFVAVNSWSWAQQMGDTRFTASSQFEDNTQFGHTLNLRTGSLAYRTPTFGFNLVDFTQTVTGELGEDRINNFSQPENVQLRGAGVILDHGKDEWSLFAGSTVPYYFLSLNATRDVAGFSFHRKQTDRFSVFGGTSYVNAPLTFTDGVHRHSYGVQTAGASYRFGKAFLVGAQGGVSNGGHLARADVSYASFRLSAYGTAIFTSQTFPLNQLQSLFSGTSTIKAGLSYKVTSRLSDNLYYEHTDVTPGLIYRFSGSSDYLSPSFAYLLTRGETLNFVYTYSRNVGGFTPGVATGNRYDVSLNSQLTRQIANNAQATIGSIQDPLQINSEDQFTLRDSISVPIKGQIFLFGVEQNRVQPSLISKLNQEITLLSPLLQAQFLANPQAFIDSTNFPPEVKAILAAEQPTGTSVSASGILALGSRLHFSPNLSVTHAANGSRADNWTEAFGYSLVYQLSPTWQLRSSLNNVYFLDTQRNMTVRTTVLGVGFQKAFTAAPGGLPLLHRSRMIEGRVFRDVNINGAYNVGEPGLAGVEVRVDDGQVAITDEQGRFKFNSVSADQHQVSIALTQFRNPVRMTTRSEADVDLIQERVAILNFGILDFARVMGNVYNDLRFENHRQPDSKGMQDVELLLDNGKEVRRIQTSGSGDFELDNVAPGDYKISLDPTSIPPNYQASSDPIAIHVSPISTVVQDIPMRALRSISGRVLLKSPTNGIGDSTTSKLHGNAGLPALKSPANVNQEFALLPLGGVQIIAGPSTATTDNDGNFLLRNLPAGDLKVTIRPVKDVPDGIDIPSGQVKLPPEPVQIQGATIVITNTELLPYLTRESPAVPGMKSEAMVASVKTHQPPINALPKPEVAPSVAPPVSAPPIKAEVTQSQASNAATPNANKPAQAQAAVEWTLTRAACEAFQSLGEKAQCFRQLKETSTSSPR